MPKYTLEQSSTVTELQAHSGTSQQASPSLTKQDLAVNQVLHQCSSVRGVQIQTRAGRKLIDRVGNIYHLKLIVYSSVMQQVRDAVVLLRGNKTKHLVRLLKRTATESS